MDRSHPRLVRVLLGLSICSVLVAAQSGCGRILATMVYVVTGTDVAAECKALEGKRVVVLCRPPTSLEYRHGGADRQLIRNVNLLLAANVKRVDVVSQAEVENWTDERDWEEDDLDELAKELDAQMVLIIDLEEFSLLKGQTLYQGKASGYLKVMDMEDKGRIVWQKSIPELLFPVNSAVPMQEKTLADFRRQYLGILGDHIARHFYDHDGRANFANDGLAHR
jgi:hypothetical protein